MSLLLALASNPELILLDEPVAGLDDGAAEEFWKMVGVLKGGHTIVAITHNITPAETVADYCGILHQG